MNEQLQQAIQQLIDKGLSGVDSSVDFIQQEIPDFVMQLLMWHGVYNFVLMSIGVLLIIVWIVVEIKLYNKLMTMNLDDHDWIIGYGLLGTLGRLVPLGFISSTLNLEWLKIWVAPKVWLVEYAASLVK